MKKIQFHLLFWVFIGLYNFDYLIDVYAFNEALGYTLFEMVLYVFAFYTHLLFLLPKFFSKQKVYYGFGLLAVLGSSFSVYRFLGLDLELLGEDLNRSLISFVLNHSLFLMFSYFAWYYIRFLKEKENRLNLENDKLMTELKLLKTQISPHFLFNTLNNIYALSLQKSDEAPKMIAITSDILRYFIYDGSQEKVALAKEITALENYISIQKMRQIPGADNIFLNVEVQRKNNTIPPLILVTILENAFKHGDIISSKDGFVKIQLLEKENSLIFEVINSFKPKNNLEGIGLENISSQLQLLFKNKAQVNTSIEENQFKTQLKIDY